MEEADNIRKETNLHFALPENDETVQQELDLPDDLDPDEDDEDDEDEDSSEDDGQPDELKENEDFAKDGELDNPINDEEVI